MTVGECGSATSIYTAEPSKASKDLEVSTALMTTNNLVGLRADPVFREGVIIITVQ